MPPPPLIIKIIIIQTLAYFTMSKNGFQGQLSCKFWLCSLLALSLCLCFSFAKPEFSYCSTQQSCFLGNSCHKAWCASPISGLQILVKTGHHSLDSENLTKSSKSTDSDLHLHPKSSQITKIVHISQIHHGQKKNVTLEGDVVCWGGD